MSLEIVYEDMPVFFVKKKCPDVNYINICHKLGLDADPDSVIDPDSDLGSVNIDP